MSYEKTYSSLGKLSITLKIGDTFKTVKFDGYDPVKKNRTLTTKDPAIQEALENSEAFGQFYAITREVKLEDPAPAEDQKAEEEENEDADAEPEDSKEEEVPKDPQGDNVKIVDTLADAKKWLTHELDVRTYPSMQREKAVELALEKGYELVIKE
jgi:hypothetical protein